MDHGGGDGHGGGGVGGGDGRWMVHEKMILNIRFLKNVLYRFFATSLTRLFFLLIFPVIDQHGSLYLPNRKFNYWKMESLSL